MQLIQIKMNESSKLLKEKKKQGFGIQHKFMIIDLLQ